MINIVTWTDFLDIVDRNFKYLETEFGLRKVSTDLPFVIYETPLVRIFIYYDIAGVKELDLSIRPFQRIGKFERDFGMGMISRLHNPDKHEDDKSPCPRTKDELENGVQKYASQLREYGSDILHGDLRDLVLIDKIIKEVAKVSSERQRHNKAGESLVEIVIEVNRKYSKQIYGNSNH